MGQFDNPNLVFDMESVHVMAPWGVYDLKVLCVFFAAVALKRSKIFVDVQTSPVKSRTTKKSAGEWWKCGGMF